MPEAPVNAPTGDAALNVSNVADAFALTETPTIALSQPILRLLANESAPTEAKEPAPALAPEPMLHSEAIQSDSTASVAGVELETTAAQEELNAPAILGRERSPGARKQAAMLIAVCVLAGALLGTRGWVQRHGTSWMAPRAPTATTPAAAALPHTARLADVKPAAAPAPTATAVTQLPPATATPSAESSAVSPAPLPLLAVDGSERPAPTCDTLLTNVPSEGEKAFDHVRAARQALIRGDVDGSQRGFCRAIRAGQTDAIVASELAQVLILRRDAASAVPWAQQALRLDPNSPRALTLLGDALVRTGNLDEARRAWLRASKLAADDRAGIERMAQASLAAADNALSERDPARAERLLRKAIAFQPENAVAHSKLGVALTRLGFAQSAEAWTKRATELSAAK